jgi:polysaccharide biosynthesis protein PslH
MKILQLCKKFPYPLKDGEAIAVTYLSRALQQLGAEVSLLSMNTSKHYFDIQQLPADFNHYHQIELVDIDNRIKIHEAFFNLFSKKSYHIQRFVSKNFEKALINLLEKNDFDLVQLETLYLAPYVETIRRHSKAKIVMRSHNVESEIWKRVAQNTPFGAKKFYLDLLTKRLEKFEIAQLNQYDLLAAITQRDLDFFKEWGCNIPACVAPIGLDLADYELSPKPASTPKPFPTCCFIGSLDWLPNTEGIEWLLQKVWPLVLKKVPQAQFFIAGRNAPDWLKQGQWKNVTVVGEVASAPEFIQQHEIMLVPLLSGGGMRVKILEGMALEKAVISTDLGAEGIIACPKTQILLANSPEQFAEKVIQCIENKPYCQQIGQQARQFIQNNYDNLAIARRLLLFYEQKIGAKTATLSPQN